MELLNCRFGLLNFNNKQTVMLRVNILLFSGKTTISPMSQRIPTNLPTASKGKIPTYLLACLPWDVAHLPAPICHPSEEQLTTTMPTGATVQLNLWHQRWPILQPGDSIALKLAKITRTNTHKNTPPHPTITTTLWKDKPNTKTRTTPK